MESTRGVNGSGVASMFQFRILGPVELVREEDAHPVLSLLNQPKRVALLAFLATSPAGYRTRDETLELFWADASQDRHALSQAVYYLRRSLGKNAVQTDGNRLQLAWEVVRCDVPRFRSALDEGRLEEAQALYRGDFLQGFLQTGYGFERWVEEERELFRRGILQALDTLSTRAEEDQDLDAAVRWAERAVELAPFLEAPMRRLLACLIARGERVHALQTYQRFAQRLARELGIQPSAETAALVEAGVERASPRSAAIGARSTVDGPPGGRSPVAPPDTASEDDAESGGGEPPADAPHRPGRPAHHPLGLPRALFRRISGQQYLFPVALVTAALLLFTGLVTYSTEVRRGSADISVVQQERVAIFPFGYRGDPSRAYLGEGVSELIGISLRGLDGISTIDPWALASKYGSLSDPVLDLGAASRIADEFGADYYVRGAVIAAGQAFQVTAHLYSHGGELVETVSKRADDDDELFRLVDDLVRALIASQPFPATTQLTRSAALTTHSLPALRHFLRGERLFRSRHFEDAIHAFDDAVDVDHSFALAYYRGAVAGLWTGGRDFQPSRQRLARALEYRHRLPEMESTLISAFDAFLRGHLPDAEKLYRQVLLGHPENLEAWFQLGETLFHYGALYGRDVSESGRAWRKVLSLSPDHRAALVHLAAVAAWDQDFATLDRVSRRLEVVNEGAPAAFEVRALRIFASGSERERARFLETIRHQPLSVVQNAASYVARYLHDIAGAVEIAEVLTDRTRPPSERVEGHIALAQLHLAEGRRRAAETDLAAAERLNAGKARLTQEILQAIPVVPLELWALQKAGGRPVAAGNGRARFVDAGIRLNPPSRLRQEPVQANWDTVSPLQLYAGALAYARASGEDGALLSAARRLEELANGDHNAAGFGATLAQALRAERELSRGQFEAAGRALDRAVLTVDRWFEYVRLSPFYSLARERFLLAEVLARSGEHDLAESLYRSLVQNSLGEVAYLGPRLLRLAELRHRAGDELGASRYYTAVLHLWAEADPEFDAVTDEIRLRLEWLAEHPDQRSTGTFPALLERIAQPGEIIRSRSASSAETPS